MPNDYAAYQQMQNAAYQQMQMEDLLRQKQENLEAALIQKHMEEELIEEELRSLPTTVQQQHPDIRSGTRYVQHVSLPNNGRPDENAYMYSSVMPDVRINLIFLHTYMHRVDSYLLCHTKDGL